MTTYLLPQRDRITTNSRRIITNRVMVAQYGNGYKQIAKDGINANRDQWDIQIAPLTGADLTLVQQFFDDVGTNIFFEWTPLGETIAKNWLVVPDSLSWPMISTETMLAEFQIEQVFEPLSTFTSEFTEEFY